MPKAKTTEIKKNNQKQNLVNIIKIAISEKKKRKRKGARKGKRATLREVGGVSTRGEGATNYFTGQSDQATRAIQQQNAQIVGHLSKQMEDIEQLKQVQNSLLASALTKSVGDLQNDIAKKTYTKGGSPAHSPGNVSLFGDYTPGKKIKIGAREAKEYLKAHKEFMRQKKDKKAEGGRRMYTDAEIDNLSDPSTILRYYADTLETQAQRAVLATHINPGGALPVTPVKQQLGDKRITLSNAKWLEGLGQMDDTLRSMVQPEEDENWGKPAAVSLFGGEGAESDESDGY